MNKQARPELSALELRLGHRFRDPGLAVLALTHLSAQNSGGQGRAESYQRLEFLGDRVLGVVIASRLYQAFPKATEGELSMRFAKLVRRETCAEIAAQWDVGPHVALGLGEARGRRAQEGCDPCGCVRIPDRGGVRRRRLRGGRGGRARRLGRARHRRRRARPRRQDRGSGMGAVARARAPRYEEVERSGPAHAPHFVMRVVLEGFEPELGAASSKRAAEQAAARAFLDRWDAK